MSWIKQFFCLKCKWKQLFSIRWNQTMNRYRPLKVRKACISAFLWSLPGNNMHKKKQDWEPCKKNIIKTWSSHDSKIYFVVGKSTATNARLLRIIINCIWTESRQSIFITVLRGSLKILSKWDRKRLNCKRLKNIIDHASLQSLLLVSIILWRYLKLKNLTRLQLWAKLTLDCKSESSYIWCNSPKRGIC